MSSSAVKAAIRGHLAEHWSATAIRTANAGFDAGGRPWIKVRFPGARTERGDISDAEHPLWIETGAFTHIRYCRRANAATSVSNALPKGDAASLAGPHLPRWLIPLGLWSLRAESTKNISPPDTPSKRKNRLPQIQMALTPKSSGALHTFCRHLPDRQYRLDAEICYLSRGRMVLLGRIELTTSPLPRECSTTELQQRRY